MLLLRMDASCARAGEEGKGKQTELVDEEGLLYSCSGAWHGREGIQAAGNSVNVFEEHVKAESSHLSKNDMSDQ